MKPSSLLLYVGVGWASVGVAAAFLPLAEVWLILGALILVWAAVDWSLTRRIPVPHCERHIVGSFLMGIDREVRLRISNQTSSPLIMVVHDHHPSSMRVLGLPIRLELSGDQIVEYTYSAHPEERGAHVFDRVELLFSRPYSFWQRRSKAGEPQEVRVFPNFSLVAHLALSAVSHQVRAMGVRQKRRRGSGLEFHQLRDYRDGDLIRQIDWKATSRRRALISKEYQEERDQQVVFALDCGRRMHARDGELSHFDHALNSILLLSYVALRQGDSVGIVTFSGDERFLPPVKGAGSLNTILNHVYDLRTSTSPSDYLEAATRVHQRIPRRALVVWLTNLRDEDDAELPSALRLLQRRHVVVLASLREHVIDDILNRPVKSHAEALLLAATRTYADQRDRTIRSLDARGIRVLDTRPMDLPRHLIESYQDVKASGIL